MEIIKICVDEEDGERLDSYLANNLNHVSRTSIQKLIKDGLILVNDKIKKPGYMVIDGDLIKIQLPKPRELQVLAENIPLNIIYQDSDIVIVNKEAGMVVHPAPGNYSGTLVNALLYHIDSLSSINGDIRPGIVHRLDKDTSGLILIAKNDFTHIKLSESFKARDIKREYIALVHGKLENQQGTINEPIGRDPKNRKRMTVISKNSKEAITHYNVLERFETFSLIEAKLETGRTHQIRVHLTFINHPIVGDYTYSNRKNNFNINTQLLHAQRLGFIHPRNNEYMEFKSNPPREFQEIIRKLK